MNEEIKEKNNYLLVLSNYLLLDDTEQENSKIINQLNQRLNEILRKIQSSLSIGEFKEKDCQAIAEQIDKLIFFSAELSFKPIKYPKKALDQFKEKLWFLLETLEEFCSENFNISIW